MTLRDFEIASDYFLKTLICAFLLVSIYAMTYWTTNNHREETLRHEAVSLGHATTVNGEFKWLPLGDSIREVE